MADEEKAPDSPSPAVSAGEVDENHKKYWQSNIRLVLILLAVWFLFGCVLSILLVDKLNQFSIGGFPLGFWVSQQGTIVVFIILVFIYAYLLQKLDRKHGVEDDGESEVLGDH
jgi:putative solute:sodium symporter small subunit